MRFSRVGSFRVLVRGTVVLALFLLPFISSAEKKAADKKEVASTNPNSGPAVTAEKPAEPGAEDVRDDNKGEAVPNLSVDKTSRIAKSSPSSVSRVPEPPRSEWRTRCSEMSENEKAANELSPEKYYELLLSRQRLQISSHKQMLVIITAHGNDPIRAMHDLKLHEMEKSVKIEKIFEYYQICPEDYYRSSRGSGVQSERAKYLDKHPEVRDELAANSAEIRALEKQVWLKMRPLWSRQQPEEAMH